MRRLVEDEKQHDYRWYADVNKGCSGKKYISFTMFDPVDWKLFEVCYFESNDTLRYCSNCDQKDIITVKVMLDMIKFIDSDEFKNLEFIDDDEYHEYIFEI